MYELENGKDQCMTSLKLALANLGMWVRERWFPPSYARATWQRLLPFFRLPGKITWGIDRVEVELQPFNDHRLTRELAAVCARANAAQSRLPDGRPLHVQLKHPASDGASVWLPDVAEERVSRQP